MLPSDGLPVVHGASGLFEHAHSEDLLFTHSLLVDTHFTGDVLHMTAQQRTEDAYELVRQLAEAGCLSAHTPLAFAFRRDDRQMQLAFFTQSQRDYAHAFLHA
jgi:hypothetical protein